VVQTVQTALSEVPEPLSPKPQALSPGFALDPTSGERLEIAKAVSAEYEGTTYYFSCSNCRAKFLKNPQKYLKGKA
jgi:YHS domain-containing protein